MIREGQWRARGCQAALGAAKNGTKQIGVDLVILDGPNEGHHITWYGYFTDGTFERTLESLGYLGWEGSDISDLRGIGKKEVMIVIEHEPDLNGELRARVKWINEIGGVAMTTKLDPGEAKAFAAQLKGRVLALQQQKGKPAATQQQRMTPAQERGEQPGAAQPTNSSDDIPF